MGTTISLGSRWLHSSRHRLHKVHNERTHVQAAIGHLYSAGHNSLRSQRTTNSLTQSVIAGETAWRRASRIVHSLQISAVPLLREVADSLPPPRVAHSGPIKGHRFSRCDYPGRSHFRSYHDCPRFHRRSFLLLRCRQHFAPSSPPEVGYGLTVSSCTVINFSCF